MADVGRAGDVGLTVSLNRNRDSQENSANRRLAINSISLIDAKIGEYKAQSFDNAFHEKAGRSQVGSLLPSSTVAILPSAVVVSI